MEKPGKEPKPCVLRARNVTVIDESPLTCAQLE